MARADVASFSGLSVLGPTPSTDTATFTIEVAFATNPGDTPTWTDVSTYVTEWVVKRGRQKELDRIDSGVATVRFKNSDRRFDPTHTSSPYYPNVLPMRRLRIRAVQSGITYPVFSGFVEAWPQTWQGSHVGWSTVNCTDAFLPLSKADVGENETWPVEFSGERINRILDAAGWPSADRSIDAGQVEVGEVAFALGAGVTALDAIREIAGAELGVFFCDGQGDAVFHDRYHRRADAYLTSQATFSDGYDAGIHYDQSLELDTAAEQIWNDVQVTPAGGETQRVEDTASQAKYLRRTMARQVPLARETEASDQAAYLASKYAEPTNRLTGITFFPNTATMWEQALARELGDHITVKRWPQGLGSQITQECSIENVELHATPSRTKVTWLLSTPAYTAVTWWRLGHATYGKLGNTTRLTY